MEISAGTLGTWGDYDGSGGKTLEVRPWRRRGNALEMIDGVIWDEATAVGSDGNG
jgi:hypothetical protein